MSENKAPKQYINGIWLEEKTFSNGNSILKLSVLPEKFIESFKAAKPNDKGYVKLVISKKLAPGKNGDTHSMYVDTWEPTGQVSQSATAPVVKKTTQVVQKKVVTTADTDENEF